MNATIRPPCVAPKDAAYDEPTLQLYFYEWNAKYFHRKLPISTRVRIEPIDPLDYLGEMEYNTLTNRAIIRVNPLVVHSMNEAGMTLLHEMVHLELHETPTREESSMHGLAFQAEMKRLANEGAFEFLW